jgi:hypothetical protein
MTKIELIETIDLSLKDLIKNDHLLFLNHVREEAVNHRFALYFENHLKIKFPRLNLHFDVEYNKNYRDQ